MGCSDYGITGEQAKENPPGDDAPPLEDSDPPEETDEEEETEEEDEPEELDCPSSELPGYPVPTPSECEPELATDDLDIVVEWSMSSFAQYSDYKSLMSTPIVVSLNDDDDDGDIDTDDVPDIVFAAIQGSNYNSSGVIRAISGDGSRELWTVGPEHLINPSNSIAGADIDGDGLVELVALTFMDSRIKAFENDGTLKWTSRPTSLACGSPAISDMDGDGSPEIVVGNYIFNSDGSIRGEGAHGHGDCTSFAVDLDNDGQQEVIAGNAVYRADGSTLWSVAAPDGQPAVADFDGDGEGEVVVVMAYSGVTLYDTDGTVLWTHPSFDFNGPPTIEDFDRDGEPEVGVSGWTHFTVFDTDGTQLWTHPIFDESSGRLASSAFDFDGDGSAEAVLADETRLQFISGITRDTRLEYLDHTSWTWNEYAPVADVDGDGQAEVILPNGQFSRDVGSAIYGIQVIGAADGSWPTARRIWNQYAYHITNINDDGTVPAVADLNWLHYNNFRSAHATPYDGTAPDLLIEEGDLCELDCTPEGELVIWVHPANQGLKTAPAGSVLVVSAQVDGSLIEVDRIELDALDPGEASAAVPLWVDSPVPTSIDQLVFEVQSTLAECVEDNNVLVLEGPFCGE